MRYIRNISDCHCLSHTPELQREVISYMLYCQWELQEYADEDEPDSQDFSFSVFPEGDNSILHDLGPPEETVQISIKQDGHTLTIHRIVYPTEVIFIQAETIF